MDVQEILKLVKFTKTLRVLYVEDNSKARASTLKMLDNFFTDITIAIDGEDGLKKFMKFRNNSEDKADFFDLIISDINMPKMNGTDMIKKIREIDTDVKILVLSAFNEQNNIDSFKELNIEGYLLKPIVLDQFLEAINKIVEKMR